MPLDLLERYYTTRNLKRKLGTRHERDFLELGAMDISDGPFPGGDDFQGDTLWGGYQSTASGAVSAAAAISTGIVNGAILLDAGTDNAGYSDLSWGLHYQAQLNAIYIARFVLPTLTTRKFEIGFTDVISGTDAGAVNVKSGNGTWRATNAVVLCRDTDDDTNLTLMGVKAGTAATSADFSTTLSAATYYYFGAALIGESDQAVGFLLDANGSLLEEEVITGAITVTTLLTPWLFVQNRAGNAGSMTVDWHRAYQRRTTTV
jgi:hypothetical protein